MKNVTILLLLTLGINFAGASEESTNSLYAKFNAMMAEYEVKVRSSVFNKQMFPDPAAFQFTSPQDGSGDDYWALDVGITANLTKFMASDWSDRFYLGPSVEYHKLTATNKPQDNFQVGINALYQLGYAEEFPYAHVFQFLPAYKNDRKGNGEGLLVKLEYLPVVPALATGGYIRGSDWLLYEWQPSVGMQYETADEAGAPKRDGEETRFKANVQLSVYPFGAKEYLNRRLQFLVGYTYWRATGRSGGFEDLRRDNRFFKVGINLYMDSEKHVALGVDYIDGANIEAGKPRQETITASFKLTY